MIAALAYVRPEDVEESFCLISDDFPEIADRFLDYFGKHFIGYTDIRVQAFDCKVSCGAEMALRWGFVGVGKISHDFHAALQVSSTYHTGTHDVIAIASRDVERSRKFANDHGIPNFYGSYEELAKDDNVEIVYVATLNTTHFEVCQLMLNHGKHVLCEKPLAMNYHQAYDLINLANNNKLFFMEGLWSRFFPAYQHLKCLTTNEYKAKEIYIKHGFCGSNVDRLTKKEMGGSILLDIGVYAIQFCLFVFGSEKPLSIKASGKLNYNGVDVEFEANLIFSGNRKATILCSGLKELENKATVVSENETIPGLTPIVVLDYWCPTSIIQPNGNIKSWFLPTSDTTVNFTNSYGLRYEADEIQKCIRSGKLFCESVTPQDMLNIAQIEDEIRKQIGVHFDCD